MRVLDDVGELPKALIEIIPRHIHCTHPGCCRLRKCGQIVRDLLGYSSMSFCTTTMNNTFCGRREKITYDIFNETV